MITFLEIFSFGASSVIDFFLAFSCLLLIDARDLCLSSSFKAWEIDNFPDLLFFSPLLNLSGFSFSVFFRSFFLDPVDSDLIFFEFSFTSSGSFFAGILDGSIISGELCLVFSFFTTFSFLESFSVSSLIFALARAFSRATLSLSVRFLELLSKFSSSVFGLNTFGAAGAFLTLTDGATGFLVCDNLPLLDSTTTVDALGEREPLALVDETRPGFRDNVLSFLSFVVFSDIFILKPKTLIYLK